MKNPQDTGFIKRFFLLFFLFLPLKTTEGKTKELLLKSEKTSDWDYDFYLKENSTYKSPLEEIEFEGPSQHQKDEILSLFTQAQKDYLLGDYKSSLEKFQSLIEKAYEEDWSESDRSLFIFSFLRSAQMTPNKKEQSNILDQALVFSQNEGLDFKSFPPFLKEFFYEIKKKKQSFLFSPSHGRTLRINGLKINKIKNIYYGKLRVTTMGLYHRPLKIILMVNDPSELPLPPPLKLPETCDRNQDLPDWGPVSYSVFYSSQCILTFSKGIGTDFYEPLHSSIIKANNFNLNKKKLDTDQFQEQNLVHESKSWFFRNRWLLIGIGGAALSSALFIFENQKKSPSVITEDQVILKPSP